LIGPEEVQRIAKSYFLALVKRYTEGNAAAGEFFTRRTTPFTPGGIATGVTGQHLQTRRRQLELRHR
jgi:hypothetical protein